MSLTVLCNSDVQYHIKEVSITRQSQPGLDYHSNISMSKTHLQNAHHEIRISHSANLKNENFLEQSFELKGPDDIY
jgi:hypothetical protein